MKKYFFLLALGLGLAVTSNAQISTGETSSKVIRTGNRAKQGNFGIFLGATSEIFKNIGDKDVKFSAIPMINLKYMYTDQLEARLGFEWYDKYTSDNNFEESKDEDIKKSSTTSESKFMFYPGVAFHFSPKNLLDVYVGAELPIGFGTIGNHSYENGTITRTTTTNAFDEEGNPTTTKSDVKEEVDITSGRTAKVFRVGLGAFIGLQAYIANLPLALGVEYGVSTLYQHTNSGSLQKDNYYISDFDDKTVNSLGTLSSTDSRPTSTKWKLGNQVRVTLSYYFSLK